MSNFMKVVSIEEIIFSINGTIDVYKTLKDDMEHQAETIDGALKISIKMWSVSSTLSEFIFQISEHLRMATTASKMKYAEIINIGHASAAKAEMTANNDVDYIRLKYEEVQKIQNYLDYLSTIKSDVDKAHYLAKEAYTRQSEQYLCTYRNKAN